MDSHETSLYYAIVASCLIIGSIIGYFVFSLFRQQRRKVREQRVFFAREIDSIEKERTRISRDLHDGAAPLLGFSKAHVNEINITDEEDRKHIEKANEAMDKLAKQIKEVAINLSPSSLSQKGLHYSLEDFFFDVRQAYSLEVLFMYEVDGSINPDTAIHLYRIVQEITNNTLKHSKARKLRVHFKEKKQKLYLWCSDDGVGFDTKQTGHKSHSQGLGNLKSRTEVLEGKFRCTSKPKHGTEYFFEFPFEGGKQGN